jgi:CTP synthase
VPLSFQEQGVDDFILDTLRLDGRPAELDSWRDLIERSSSADEPVRIALVGKYVKLEDAYLSVSEALRHGGYAHGAKVEIDWIDSEDLERPRRSSACAAPTASRPRRLRRPRHRGQDPRGEVAREDGIPYLGICLGMQIAVAEFARHVAGMDGANSTEFDPETPFPVIDLLPEQKEVADLGGTMRLGADPIKLHAGTRARELYGEAVIYERHRHRYEVNNLLRKRSRPAGLVISGTSPDERLVEVVELRDHPFFVASQYHPEFKSRPERPSPLFAGFVQAALERVRAGRGRTAGEVDEHVATCTTRGSWVVGRARGRRRPGRATARRGRGGGPGAPGVGGRAGGR